MVQFGYLDRVVELKLQSGDDSGPTDEGRLAAPETYFGAVDAPPEIASMVRHIKANYRANKGVATATSWPSTGGKDRQG